MPITIRELKATELTTLYPLIRQLNPSMTKPQCAARLKAMIPLGYRAAGVFSGKKLVGCSGFWIRTRFWDGRELDIDNFIVDAKHRGKGIGEKLTAWLEKKAKAEGCDILVLDVYSSNVLAHRFYHAQGFTLTGYHMTKRPGTTQPWTRNEASCAR